jgi:hypothetical protein
MVDRDVQTRALRLFGVPPHADGETITAIASSFAPAGRI